MAEMNIMPLYTDALLADTHMLSHERFGQYMRLLAAWWRDGCKPSNLDHLESISGIEIDDLERLNRFLTETDEGFIQKRLFETWNAQTEKRVKARKSAEARWGKPSPQEQDNAAAYAKPMRSSNANAMRPHGSSICSSDANASKNDANAMLSMIHEPLLLDTSVSNNVDMKCSRTRERDPPGDKNWFEKLLEVLDGAIADPARSPAMAVSTIPNKWRELYDWDGVVIPALRAWAAKFHNHDPPKKPVNSWTYFDQMLADLNRQHTVPEGEIYAQNSQNNGNSQKLRQEKILRGIGLYGS